MELPSTPCPEDDILIQIKPPSPSTITSINALRSLLDFALLAAWPLWTRSLVLQRVTAWQLTTVFGLVSQLVADLFSQNSFGQRLTRCHYHHCVARLFHFVNE
ncbi:MAG: hypothetical protein IPJ94_24535 [Chloroflexi bacterium]|nr:hypothetical protein [Chloroflexota bacterium]